MKQIIDELTQQRVLSLLCKNTTLLAEYVLTSDDFEDLKMEITNDEGETEVDPETLEPLYYTVVYKQIFEEIKAAHNEGLKILTADSISESKRVREWIAKFGATESNFKAYYNSLRKTTILRKFAEKNIVLDKYIWHYDNDKAKKEAFNKISIEELLKECTKPSGDLFNAQSYGTRTHTIDASKVELEEIEAIYDEPSYGYNTMSPMLNEMIGGWRKNTFNLIIASSGVGKSMTCFSNIAYGFASKFYVDGEWKCNKGLNKNKVLYIGTEMDLLHECFPQIICCVGGLDYNKYKKREFSKEERARYNKACEVIKNDGKFLLKDDNDYNYQSLRDMVNSDEEIETVFIDYLEVTQSLGEEQPDSIRALNDLARLCKENLAKNKAIIAMAQANIDLEDKKLGEIDANYIKGSHTLHQKADTLLFLMKGSDNDLKELTKANSGVNFEGCFGKYEDLSKGVGSALTINPERIRKVLLKGKTRGCSTTSGACLWCYVEPGTLRWHDLFVTDLKYELMDLKGVIIKDGKIL